MPRNSITHAVLMLSLLAGGTIALADPNSNPVKPEDALKGPAVPDRRVPGVDNGLSEKGRGKLNMAQEVQIPQQAFMRMIEEAVGPSANESVRMTETQRAQVKKANDDFAARQRAFMQEHEADIKALLQEHPEMARVLREQGLQVPGGRPGAGGPGGERRPGGKGPEKGPEGGPPGDRMQPGSEMSPDDRSRLQAKVQELKALAPRQEDTRAAIWAVLTKDQQAAVQTKVDAFKAQRQKDMDERYKQREKERLQERGQKGETRPGAPGGDGFKALDPAKRAEVLKSLPQEAQDKIASFPAEQQDRILARLSNLPPEGRAKALEEMKRRLQEGGGKGGKRPGAPAPGSK